ncbi:kallikrein related peptidase 8, partial [Homo sapiens]
LLLLGGAWAGNTQYAWETTAYRIKMAQSKKYLWFSPSHTPATTAAMWRTTTMI